MPTLDIEGARILVLGLGVTGRAVARWLVGHGATVLASDAAALDAGALEAIGVEVETGGHDLARSRLEDFDAVVPSPGISPHRGFLAEVVAGGTPVISELDLAERYTDATIVGVTGTKGKTTVCRLTTRILVEAGLDAHACGNTELPVVAALDDHPGAEVLVVEASSFRLAFCRTFRPKVAVITNLAPDHLDWHADMADYTAAKANLMARQTPDDLFLFPADQPELADLAPEAGPRRAAFGRMGTGAWVDRDEVVVGALRAAGAACLTEGRPHLAVDVAASAAAAVELGVDAAAIERALGNFSTDPHTLEAIGSLGGIRFFDDSKATNPTATIAALRSFDASVLIAGGLNKGLDLTPLAGEAGLVRAVVAIGAAADEIVAAFDGTGVTVERAPGMREAVEAAIRLARSGDVVLLSPACASQDAYSDYAERGDEFRAICTSLGVGM